jgi:hypothetical protein
VKRDQRAGAGLGMKLESPAQHLRRLLGDREPETESGVVGATGPDEPVEDARLHFGWDAGTGVANANLERALGDRLGDDLDAAVLRVLHRVADHAAERLLGEVRVDNGRKVIRARHLDLDSCARSQIGDEVVEERPEQQDLRSRRLEERLRAGEDEQGTRDPLEAPRLALDVSEKSIPLLGVLGARLQDLDGADDPGQRALQLVGGVGDEVALRPLLRTEVMAVLSSSPCGMSSAGMRSTSMPARERSHPARSAVSAGGPAIRSGTSGQPRASASRQGRVLRQAMSETAAVSKHSSSSA